MSLPNRLCIKSVIKVKFTKIFHRDIFRSRTLNHSPSTLSGVCELCRRQEKLLKLAVTERVELEVIEYENYHNGDNDCQLGNEDLVLNLNGVGECALSY